MGQMFKFALDLPALGVSRLMSDTISPVVAPPKHRPEVGHGRRMPDEQIARIPTLDDVGRRRRMPDEQITEQAIRCGGEWAPPAALPGEVGRQSRRGSFAPPPAFGAEQSRVLST